MAGARAEIFTTLDGNPVSVRYVQAMVKRHAARAGITKSVHPHTLRHSFATDLYRETKDIRLTQKALGHANSATTQIYTHLVDEDLEAALKSFRQAQAVAVWVGRRRYGPLARGGGKARLAWKVDWLAGVGQYRPPRPGLPTPPAPQIAIRDALDLHRGELITTVDLPRIHGDDIEQHVTLNDEKAFVENRHCYAR